MKQYVRLVGVLCLLCAMIGPALSLLSDPSPVTEGLFEEREEDIDYDEIYNNSLISGGERQVADALKSSIIKDLDLSSDSLEVWVRSASKSDTDSFAEVTVSLRPEAIFADPRRIVALVEGAGDFRCIIVYE